MQKDMSCSFSDIENFLSQYETMRENGEMMSWDDIVLGTTMPVEEFMESFGISS